MQEVAPLIVVEGLKNYLGGRWVHQAVNLTIAKGEIIAIIGGSGCGKTTLLRTLLMLQKPTGGTIKIFGQDIARLNPQQALKIQQRWGVMFQSSALFSSLSVLRNVMFPLNHYSRLTDSECEEIALLKILLAGLEISAASKYPSELSGGMKKRAALARALAFDPELLFLDEPTAGLDPHSAAELDDLVLQLRESLGLTFVIVTHDLDTLWKVPDRIIFLGEGKVLADARMDALLTDPNPLIQRYFSGRSGKDRYQPASPHGRIDDGR